MTAALDLALRGFYVFPLRRGTKLPAVKAWEQYATREPDTKDYAHGENVGIATGPSGLLVVDVDVKHGKHGDVTILDLEIQGHELPSTLTALTPSGGKHLFYRVARPVKSGVDVLGPGVDIRSGGGFVVGVGSVVNAGEDRGLVEYAFAEPTCPLANAPQWLIDACGKPRERAERPNEVKLTGYAAEVAHAKATRYLSTEAPVSIEGDGGDSVAYSVACRVRDFGVSQSECLELMLDWNERCQPPWNTDDLARKVQNAYTYAVNKAGLDNPAVVFEPVAALSGTVPSAEGTVCRYRLESVADVLDRPPPPWLIRGLIPQRGLAMLYGAPGSGKTFLALDLMCAIALGSQWAHRRTRQGIAVYVGLEGHAATRLRAYAEHHGVAAETLHRLRIVERQPVDLLSDKDVAELARDIRAAEIEPALVVIDTLNRSMPGGDENSSTDMGKVIMRAGWLADNLDCTVLFVHHSGKNEDAGARGHSSLHGAVDAALAVSRTETGARIVEAAKVKDGEDGEQFAFDLETVDLGAVRDFDPEAADDERLTSCVVVNLRPVEKSVAPKKLHLGTHAANALTAFREVLSLYETDPQRAFEDDSVLVDQWIDAFISMYEGDPAARSKFYSARAELLRKKVITTENNRAALTPLGKLV